MSSTIAHLQNAGRDRSAVDHPGTIASYYPFWDVQYRPFLLAAVDAFPLDRLDFKPRPEVFTARQVILHIAEAERWWLHHIVGKEPYEDYVLQNEDGTPGFHATIDAPDHAALKAILADCHLRTQHWLAQPISELPRVITHERKDRPTRQFTLHWILDHLQEHEIHHRAQLNLYLRLMGLTPPSI